MMIDFLLSALHFLLAFTLIGILATQGALIRPGMTAQSLRLAANLDRAYGASAMLLLGAGFGRVFLGAKGSQFYLSNPVFWAKIGFFAAVAALSIPPTVQLIQWSKQAGVQAGFLARDNQVRRTRSWLLAEGITLAFIPIFAAAMARGFGIR